MNTPTTLQLKEYLSRSPEWLKTAYYHNALMNHTLELCASGNMSYEDMKWKLAQNLLEQSDRLLNEKIEQTRYSFRPLFPS